MSFQERMPITVIAVATLAYGVFLVRMNAARLDGRFDAPDALAYTGRTLLIFVAAFIVLVIIAHIAQAFLESIRTGDEDAADEGEDERDRAYEFHSLRIQSVISGVFFCLALGLLWAGSSAPMAIHVIFFGFYVGMVIGEGRKLLLYRNG